jgi:WD40 repeat protein
VVAAGNHAGAVAVYWSAGPDHTFDLSSQPVTAVHLIDLGGRTVLAARDAAGTAAAWDLSTLDPVRIGSASEADELLPPATRPRNVSWALLDGRLVAVRGHADGTVTLDGEPVAAHRGAVTAVAVLASVTGDLVVTGGADSFLCTWDLRTGRQVDALDLASPVLDMVVTDAGGDRHVVVRTGGEIVVFKWGPAPGAAGSPSI